MPKLEYDGLITIATGSSRRSTSWKNKEMLWSEFVDKLSKVYADAGNPGGILSYAEGRAR